MRTTENKKEIQAKISEKKKEISELQIQLNSTNEKKEQFFKKKTELSEKINSLAKEIRSTKSTRDKLTNEVKNEKIGRDKFNKEVRVAVDKIKNIEDEKKKLLTKHNVKDPSKISRTISALEYKIETEPMKFEKEKKIMKELKILKKQLKEVKTVSGVVGEIQDLSQDIDLRKKIAQESHKKIQIKAKESQVKHEALGEVSKEMAKIKTMEEAAFKEFIDNKKKFNEINTLLKKSLNEIQALQGKLDSDKKSTKIEKTKKNEKKLEEKKLSVEEKIKKGIKLTTEDLLAFQGVENTKDN